MKTNDEIAADLNKVLESASKRPWSSNPILLQRSAEDMRLAVYAVNKIEQVTKERDQLLAALEEVRHRGHWIAEAEQLLDEISLKGERR